MVLYRNTVSDLLWDTLKQLMSIEAFNAFRLVGGTSLSLQLGHRESVDIDLFTDAEYASIDFENLEKILRNIFPYVTSPYEGNVGMGKSFFIGIDEVQSVKLDLFYTDPFIFPCLIEDNIRFSSIEEIAAMKFEVIGQGGRKKDFWDLHELLEKFSLDEMIDFYLRRYPYGSSKNEILTKIVDFSLADEEFIPNCFRGKQWELIKLDFEELVTK